MVLIIHSKNAVVHEETKFVHNESILDWTLYKEYVIQIKITLKVSKKAV